MYYMSICTTCTLLYTRAIYARLYCSYISTLFFLYCSICFYCFSSIICFSFYTIGTDYIRLPAAPVHSKHHQKYQNKSPKLYMTNRNFRIQRDCIQPVKNQKQQLNQPQIFKIKNASAPLYRAHQHSVD
jgi:hypothetical protein